MLIIANDMEENPVVYAQYEVLDKMNLDAVTVINKHIFLLGHGEI